MDLFAPCRSCLQCLPFFHVSPPARVTASTSSPSPSSDASKATSADPAQATKSLPSPPSAAAPAAQEQHPRPIPKAEYQSSDAFAAITDSEAMAPPGIVIAPPVTSPHSSVRPHKDTDEDKATNLPEKPLDVPYINDVTFSAVGFLPPQSPITPAPFGPGYPANQYPPPQGPVVHELPNGHKRHESEDLQHAGDVGAHHGLGHSHHGHMSPEHGHVSPQTQDSDQQGNVSICADGVGDVATEHTSIVDKIDHISPAPHLEVSQSTPELDLDATIGGETSAGSHTNGASDALETYYSEPLVVEADDPLDIDEVTAPSELLEHGGSPGTSSRRPGARRRDLLKNNLKGFRQQIKQGGLHLKEEGNKYVQTVLENVSKQAQQREQSGSFFIVPRVSNK